MIKKLLKIVGGVIALLVVALGALGWSTFGGLKPLEDGTEVGGGHTIKDGIVASFMIYSGQQQVVLIDAGQDTDAKAIKAELQKRNLPIDAVKAIFLTHGHKDHIGGVNQFPNAEVYASFAEVNLVAGNEKGRAPLMKVMSESGPTAKVTHPLKDGDEVKVGDLTVKAFLVPGHTDGSMVYLANGVLYMGDSGASTSGGELKPAAWLFSNDTKQNVASLKALPAKLEGSDVKTLAFAHSGPLDGLKPLKDFADHATP